MIRSYSLLALALALALATLMILPPLSAQSWERLPPYEPETLMEFAMCRGAVDGLSANVASVITATPETVPVMVLEMQAELSELNYLTTVINERIGSDDEMQALLDGQSEQAVSRYDKAFAAHRDSPQSIATIIGYVDESLGNLDVPCEQVVEGLAAHYFPAGYPRQID